MVARLDQIPDDDVPLGPLEGMHCSYMEPFEGFRGESRTFQVVVDVFYLRTIRGDDPDCKLRRVPQVPGGEERSALRAWIIEAGSARRLLNLGLSGDVPYAVDLRVIEAAVSRVDGSYAAFC